MSIRLRKGYFDKADPAVYEDYESLTAGDVTEIPASTGSGHVLFEEGYFVPRM